MSNLLSKSLLIAGVCITALAATAPSSAHDTGTWIAGTGNSCITICKKNGLEAVLSGHVGSSTTLHYAVCRVRTGTTATNFTPGFNVAGKNFCYAYSAIVYKVYDCLCLKC